MRVLIVDENEAIREMMTDILTAADRDVRSAGTVMGAVDLFNSHRPEVVFMNTRLGEETTAKLVKIMSREEVRPKLIMMANSKAEITTEVYVDGWLCKPFRSADVMDVMNGAEVRSEKKPSRLRNFFSRPESSPYSMQKEVVRKDDMKLKFGVSYLFLEDDPVQLRNACKHFAARGDNVLFITSGTVKGVKELIRDDSIKIMALSSREGERYICGNKIGSVTGVIMSFVNSEKSPVVIIDDLFKLIDLNDLNSVLVMISQTINNVSKKPITLLASMRPDAVTERDKGLLLHNMTEYERK